MTTTAKRGRRAFSLVVAVLLVGVPATAPGMDFLRGNANDDSRVDLSDAVCILLGLFAGPSAPGVCRSSTCKDALDTNDDGRIDISDAISILSHLFQGTPPPPPPGGNSCGPDPTEDPLDCEFSAACAIVDSCPDDPHDDIDGDEVCGDVDNCPEGANPAQTDTDGDGLGDVCDNCPTTSNADQADSDSDGTGNVCDSDSDSDSDGFVDSNDNCPDVRNPGQEDSDGDLLGDACDNCPAVSNSDQRDMDGDDAGNSCDNCRTVFNSDQTDIDLDGVGDSCDNCPDAANSVQADNNGDGAGDACDSHSDGDADGLVDAADNCPDIANPAQEDMDGDLVGDACDSCPITFDATGADTDGDGMGDVCDTDSDVDADGVLDKDDNCPDILNVAQEDGDRDGVGDACDNCPAWSNATQLDADLDGFGEPCDPFPCPVIRTGLQGLQQNASLAVDDTGGFVVIWEADPDENDLFQIRGRAYNADGSKRIRRFSVNATSAGQQINPAVATDGGGRFAAVWEHDGNIDGVFDIVGRGFNADGTERIAEFVVNADTTGQQLSPAIAMDSTGRLVITWAHDGNRDGVFDIVGRGFNVDGTERLAEFVVNAGTTGQQLSPAIAMDATGNFLVVWEHDGNRDGVFDIVGRGFNADGTERIPEFVLNPSTGGQQIGPAVAMDTSGNSIVVWEHDGNENGLFEIVGRGFNADGTVRIPEYTVNTNSSGQQVDPTVAMNAAGNFAVAWEADRDSDGEFHVRFRGFNADGTETFAPTKADCAEPAQHRNPVIEIDGSGRILVFWDETSDFLGPSETIGRTFPGDLDHDGLVDTVDNCPTVANPRQEDTDGAGVGDACDNCPALSNPDQVDIDEDGLGDLCDPFSCSLTRAGRLGLQRNGNLAVDDAGNVFVVWEADVNENDRFDIRGTAFNPDGTERLLRFTVNSTSSGQQFNPAIAADDMGGFAVVWEHDGNGDGVFDILSGSFNPDGTERIAEFDANSTSHGQQLDPAIAMDSSGRFVVVWEHDGNGDGVFDIFARAFNADGKEIIPELTVNADTTGQQLDPAAAIDAAGNFVVVWAHDGNGDGFFDILGRGFNVDGTERIGEFDVNVTTRKQQIHPAIGMNAGGGFVVAWEHDGNADGLFETFARGFNADGTESILEFRVNMGSSGQQVDPAVAVNAAGKFAIAWEDDGDNDGEFHVRFRGFNADGTENLAQTRSDCTEPAQHLNPVIGIDGSGQIHVFWDETPNFFGPSKVIGRAFPPAGP